MQEKTGQQLPVELNREKQKLMRMARLFLFAAAAGAAMIEAFRKWVRKS